MAICVPSPGFESEPAPVMNTTPLIDLMLVLIVMFIVSVPIATHKVPLDLGGGPPTTERPPVHRLDIDTAGRLSWDGQPIPDGELAERLAVHAADPSLPELHIAAQAETRYERVDEILAEVGRAGITRMGLIGNERFAEMMD